ncbi:hypothetical protein GZ78_20540 [Endozoicomonas numazuensis]|uniref:Uncharacterized protein n=2 Tax=Endozoicomonas numazuensis TaxID=1137799 RepID=A0A081NEY4_9GAMM|nr:hypothetical protein GZ78_20540 [Endozoicomonas numazuensis]
MIDSYKIKIETWASIDVYSETGPNIDVYPVELSMQQRLFNVDDPEEVLLNAKDKVQESAQNFALNWQKQGAPSWDFGERLEGSVETLTTLINDRMSVETEAEIRARQLELLLQITSIYVFMGNEVATTYDITQDLNVEDMVAELSESIRVTPISDHSFAAKWRYIKPVILKMDFRAPDLVKRHALSMAVILQRSLDS